MRSLKTFTFAAITVLIALLLTLLLPPLRQHFKFLLFAFAICISATRGVWEGVFATLLSAVLAIGLLMPPLRTLAFSDEGDLVRLILFIAVGLVISLITRRLQQSDEAVRDAAAVVESSADSIMRQGLDNTIQSWNKAAERMYGYTAHEAIGRPVSLIFPPDRREEQEKLSERVNHGGSIQGHETVRVRKDGTLIDIAVTLSPVQNRKEKIVGVSSIARRLPTSKQAEEALRHSHAELERQTHQLRLLAEMGEMLQASSVPADAYAVTARYIQTLIPACSGALYVHSASKDNVEVVLKWGEPLLNEHGFPARRRMLGLANGSRASGGGFPRGLLCRHCPRTSPGALHLRPHDRPRRDAWPAPFAVEKRAPSAGGGFGPGFFDLTWPREDHGRPPGPDSGRHEIARGIARAIYVRSTDRLV